MKRLMKESTIPAFVDEVIRAGCDICAVGHDKYHIGDADLSPAEYEKVWPALEQIEESYAIAITLSWRSSPICARSGDIWTPARQRSTGPKTANFINR
ncbi:hypothetical protein ABIA23_006897 [Sinorhizobium fredii]